MAEAERTRLYGLLGHCYANLARGAITPVVLQTICESLDKIGDVESAACCRAFSQGWSGISNANLLSGIPEGAPSGFPTTINLAELREELLSRTLAFCGACLDKNLMEEAVHAIDRAVKLAPQSTDVRLHRANLAIHTGDYELAEADYSEILRASPDEVNALVGLVRCQIKMQAYALARETLRHILQLEPGHEGALAAEQELMLLVNEHARSPDLPMAATPVMVTAEGGRLSGICLATNYLVMNESTLAMWRDLHINLLKMGMQLVLLNSAKCDQPLPFPVISIPYLIKNYEGFGAAGVDDAVLVGAYEMELLQNESARSGGAYPPFDAFAGLRACRAFLRKVFEALQPNHVLAWDSTSPLAFILREMCLLRAVPFHSIERGLFPETLTVETLGIQGWSDQRTHWLAVTAKPISTEESYQRIKSYYLSKKPQKYDHAEFGEGGAGVRRQLRLGDKRVMVFFGQFDPCGLEPQNGLQRPYHSPEFGNTADAVMELWKTMSDRADIAIVFKPHPMDQNAYYAIKALGVEIVRDVNPHVLIDLADVVVTQLTTLQFEAALYDKPVVLLSRSAWWGRNAAYEVRQRDSLKEVLCDALARKDWDVHSRNAQTFITWTMENFHIGCLDSTPTRLKLADFAKFIVETSLTDRNRADVRARVRDLVGLDALIKDSQ